MMAVFSVCIVETSRSGLFIRLFIYGF